MTTCHTSCSCGAVAIEAGRIGRQSALPLHDVSSSLDG